MTPLDTLLKTDARAKRLKLIDHLGNYYKDSIGLDHLDSNGHCEKGLAFKKYILMEGQQYLLMVWI